ncbi:MAG: hypothetical protein ACRC11_12120 [Xenococcaceae cyanobacterium]
MQLAEKIFLEDFYCSDLDRDCRGASFVRAIVYQVIAWYKLKRKFLKRN